MSIRKNFIAPYNYIDNQSLASEISANGYAVINFLNKEQIDALTQVYQSGLKMNEAGFFFTMFSRNIDYRREVFQKSISILESSLRRFFKNYKIGNSGFVVRGPNDKGEFFVHQDPSFVDEHKYSPLHIWCPLVDIDMDFAPVCLIPKSHLLSSPYRSITVPAPFEEIRNEVRKYVQPILVKAGQALLLDPRLIHNSLPNKKNQSRPVLLVQMFPEGAPFVTPVLNNDRLEMYSLPETYFLENTNFIDDVLEKPAIGALEESIPFEKYTLTIDDFLTFCKEHGIEKNNLPEEVVYSNAMNQR